ncbi:MAG: glycosyltransferase family 2 protein, partial [Gemmatimonadaceae bacterium]
SPPAPSPMLYLCIPAYNEAPTVGLVLWRIRKVFEEHSREYEVIVLDDGSTDATSETLEPYRDVMPLTILRNDERGGYAAAIDTLARAASKKTRYPRRDAAIFMQADFTDQPEHVPELVKRFEGGADVVVAEQDGVPANEPTAVRRLRAVARFLVRGAAKVDGVDDPFGSFRLVRIAVLRDLIKARGDTPLVNGAGWTANLDFLLALRPFARRVEAVALGARYDLRPRNTRVRPFAGALDLYKFGRAHRAGRVDTSPT